MMAVRDSHQIVSVRRGGGVLTSEGGVAPAAATSLFTMGTTGSPARTQLTRLRGNGRDWYFDAAPLARLIVFDGGDVSTGTPFTPAHFDSEVANVTASSFTITWTGVTALTVLLGFPDTTTMVATGSSANGILEFTSVTVTLSAAAASAYGCWAVDYPYLKVKPYEVANKSQMECLFPAWSGSIVRNTPQVLVADLAAPHPGNIAAAPQTTLLGLHACVQAMSLHQRDKDAALLLRTKDTTGRLKAFCLNGDGTNTIMYVRHWNEADQTIGRNFASFYATTLEPLAKSPHQVCEHIRGKLQAESSPAVARGKLKDDSGNAISTILKTAPLRIWVRPGTGASSAIWTRAAQEVLRVKSDFGVTPVVHFENYEASLNWPDWSPVVADAETFLSTMDANGVKVGAYFIPERWGATSTWRNNAGTPPTGYNTATTPGSPSADELLKNDQSALTTVDGAFTFNLADLGDASARTHIKDQIVPILNGGARKIQGFYLDAVTNQLRVTYRAALATNQKGHGSDRNHLGRRAIYTELRTALRAVVADAMLYGEGPEDLLSDVCEMFGPNSYVVGDGYDYWPMFRAILGEYVPLMGFDSYGIGGPGTEGLFPALYWNQAKHFHDGKIQTLLYFGGGDSTSYLISQAGDVNHSWWLTYGQAYMAFVKVLVKALDTGCAFRKYTQRGRRLAPLIGLQDDYVEANGVIASIAANTLMGSAWVSDESGAGVGIALTNGATSDASYQLQFGAERYPEIAGGVRYLYETNVTTGVKALIKSFFGAFVHTVSVPARSLKTYELLTS